MIHSMRKQDLHAIAARLNLALSGTKQELFHRLLNHEKKIHTRISISSETKSQTKRVSGRRFPLRGLEIELSRALGIRNRILENPSSDANEFVTFQRNAELYYAQHGFPINFTNCHVNSRLQINKKICDFCLNKTSCNEQESRTSDQSIDVIFETLNTNDVEEDINRIREWFNRRKQEQHIFPNVYRIFSDPVNPFRPGFVSGKSNQIFLTVLSEVNTVASSASCNWNHLFFSYPLRRTLTAFESLYLNAAIFSHRPIGKIQNSKGSEHADYPSLHDLHSFLMTHFNSHSTTVDEWRTHVETTLDQLGLSGTNTEILDDSDEFLRTIIQQTKQLFCQGFFDEKLEIFSNFDPDLSFQEHIYSLWIELFSTVAGHEPSNNIALISPRTQAQILYDPESIDQASNLSVPNHLQTLRFVEVVGLNQPWILTNAQLHNLDFIMNEKEEEYPHSWAIIKPTFGKVFFEKLSNSRRKYDVRIWPNILPKLARDSYNAILNVYHSGDIFSALSSNMLRRKLINSPGDAHHRIVTERFWDIFEVIFFSLLHNPKVVLEQGIELQLRELLNEFNHPMYRRFKPLDVLIKLSDFNPRSNTSCDFVDFVPGNPQDETTIDSLVITSPQHKITTDGGENEVEALRWEFNRKSKNVHSGNEFRTFTGKWKIAEVEGRKIAHQRRRIESLEDVLNWIPESEKLGRVPNYDIFLSKRTCEAAETGTISEEILADLVLSVLNQQGTRGCPFIIMPDERDEIEALSGAIDFSEVTLSGSDIVVLVGLPSEPASFESPNLLHVGVLGH